MFLVKTELKTSSIPGAGLGVFALQDIKEGDIIGIFDGWYDRLISAEAVKHQGKVFEEFIQHYAYRDGNTWYLGADNMRFMNHSDNDPNVDSLPGTGDDIAARDIKAGEELTCNYYNFDADADRKLGRTK